MGQGRGTEQGDRQREQLVQKLSSEGEHGEPWLLWPCRGTGAMKFVREGGVREGSKVSNARREGATSLCPDVGTGPSDTSSGTGQEAGQESWGPAPEVVLKEPCGQNSNLWFPVRSSAI